MKLGNSRRSWSRYYRISAWDALRYLSLEDALDALTALDDEYEDDWRERANIAKARAKIERRVTPEWIGARPKGVPERAKRRTITTAAGRIDIWYWDTRRGYRSAFGGPRAWSVGPKGPTHDSFGAAVKRAGIEARSVYGKPNRSFSVRLRYLVLERDGFTCRYCGRKAPDVELHIDHVVSRTDGGATALDNLVTACTDCNLGKNYLSVVPDSA